MLIRPTVDQTLLQVAWVMALRGTCSRLQVGAVLARDGRLIGSGWNGAPAHQPHCEHGPADESCRVAIHAERNCLGYTSRAGISTDGTTLYVTAAPCWDCASVVLAAGVARVVYAAEYGSLDGVTRLRECGVLVQSACELVA